VGVGSSCFHCMWSCWYDLCSAAVAAASTRLV
jgi:hypothetical protein